jgi:hypothetical protein
MSPASLLDPKIALLGGTIAALSSERVRHTIGHGLGYGVAGVMKVGDAFVASGRDIYGSAREVAVSQNGPSSARAARKRSSAAA